MAENTNNLPDGNYTRKVVIAVALVTLFAIPLTVVIVVLVQKL